jgi:hypothetical protein
VTSPPPQAEGPPPPQIEGNGHVPQVVMVPPQPSPDGPHATPKSVQDFGMQAADPPQTLGDPPPPQVSGAVHPPQSILPPHPSPARPQLAPTSLQVSGVHVPESVVEPSPPVSDPLGPLSSLVPESTPLVNELCSPLDPQAAAVIDPAVMTRASKTYFSFMILFFSRLGLPMMGLEARLLRMTGGDV